MKKRFLYYCLCLSLGLVIWGTGGQVFAVTITADQTIADQFTRHTVTGITTPLPVSPDVTGFIGASYLTIGDLNNDGKKEIICTSGMGADANQNTADGAVAIFTRGSNLDSWTK